MDPETREQWEQEVQAALKKLGYPGTETSTNPISLLPRVITCLTRRLQGVLGITQELGQAVDEEKNDKTAKKLPSGETIMQKIPACILICIRKVSF